MAIFPPTPHFDKYCLGVKIASLIGRGYFPSTCLKQFCLLYELQKIGAHPTKHIIEAHCKSQRGGKIATAVWTGYLPSNKIPIKKRSENSWPYVGRLFTLLPWRPFDNVGGGKIASTVWAGYFPSLE